MLRNPKKLENDSKDTWCLEVGWISVAPEKVE